MAGIISGGPTTGSLWPFPQSAVALPDVADTQTGSRIFTGSPLSVGTPKLAVQVAGATNQGGAVQKPVPAEREQAFRESRIIPFKYTVPSPRLKTQVANQTNQANATTAPIPGTWDAVPPSKAIRATAWPGPKLKPQVANQTNQGGATAGAPVNLPTVDPPRLVVPPAAQPGPAFRVGVASPGATNQNGVAVQPPVDLTTVDPPRIVVPPATAPAFRVGLTVQGQNGTFVAQPVSLLPDELRDAGSRTYPALTSPVPVGRFGVSVAGHTNQGGQTFAPLADYPTVDQSRLGTPPPAVVVPPVPPRLGVAVPGQTNQSGVASGPVADYPTVDPPRVVTPPPAQTTPPPAVTLGVAIPGATNQGFSTRGPDQWQWPDVDLLSRSFVYYNAAPPIYRPIVPGSTNQSFTAVPVPLLPGEQLGPSRQPFQPKGFQQPPIYRVVVQGGTNTAAFLPVPQPVFEQFRASTTVLPRVITIPPDAATGDNPQFPYVVSHY